jgi:hypothetical protein
MLYYRCPSCRTNLANKEILLETELEKLKYSKRKKGDIKEILNRCAIINSCCVMRALCYVDTIKIIK